MPKGVYNVNGRYFVVRPAGLKVRSSLTHGDNGFTFLFPQYTPEPTLLCTFIPEIHEFAHGKPHYWCYTFSVTLFFLPPLKKNFFSFHTQFFPF